MSPRTGSLLVLASSVLWGTTGTAQALAPAGASPLAVASVRIVLGGVVLVGLAARGRPLVVGRLSFGPTLVAAGSLVAAQLCFFAAVDRTGVAVGTVVSIGSSPIALGVLEWAIARRRPTLRWLIATGLAVTGCVLLLTVGRSLDVDSTGVALALVVGLGYAGYILGTKLLVSDHAPHIATAVVFAGAAVLMAPILVGVDLGWLVQPVGAVIALHLGLVTVALAYSLFARALVAVSASAAVTLTLAEPLTAGLLGVVVLGERLSGAAVAGVVLVLSGLTIMTASAVVRDPTPAA
jgi:DME family drug/metabolite transporter